MPRRFAALVTLAALVSLVPISAHAAAPDGPPGGGMTPPSSSATPALGAPAPHRFFFANAQRESLSGPARTRQRMRTLVGDLTKSKADFGVLVELQGTQPKKFRAATSGTWKMVAPGTGVRNGVIYNQRVWKRVSTSTIATFWNHKRPTHIPAVTLRNAEGHTLVVIAIHNPKDNRHLRQVNNQRIMKAVRRLHGVNTPVIVAGDFNDTRAAQCWYTAPSQGMVSASHPGSKPCTSHRASWIDQAFGTREVTFSKMRRTFTTATDHRAVYSVTVSLTLTR